MFITGSVSKAHTAALEVSLTLSLLHWMAEAKTRDSACKSSCIYGPAEDRILAQLTDSGSVFQLVHNK